MKKLLLFFLLFLNACKLTSPPNQNRIEIGEVAPLTGLQASFGVASHRGVELAIEEANAQGGVQGKRIQLWTVDNQSRPEEVAVAANQLIQQRRVLALLGDIGSSRSLVMAPIAQSFQIPMVTPGATNPRVTQVGDFIFRTCFIDSFQGEVMADFSIKNLKIRKIAILKDIKSDYSMGLAEAFEKSFEKLGGKILVSQAYGSGDLDFKAQLTAIRTKTPEALYIPGSYMEVGLIARQARDLGIQVPIIGGDSWDSPRLIEIAGNAIEDSYFSNHYAEDDPSDTVRKFVVRFKRAYHVEPDGLAALGYDGARVLLDALKRAKSLDPKSVREALSETRNFPVLNGTISIDSNRNAKKSVVILQIVKGKFKYRTTYEPRESSTNL